MAARLLKKHWNYGRGGGSQNVSKKRKTNSVLIITKPVSGIVDISMPLIMLTYYVMVNIQYQENSLTPKNTT